MKQLFILSFIALMIFSCTEDGPEKNTSVPVQEPEYSGEKIQEDTLVNVKDTIKTDTLGAFRVSGKAIVFMMPSEKEFQEMVEREGEDSGISEVASDFTYYTTELIDSLKKSDIKTYQTTNPVTVILYGKKTKVVDRRKIDHIVATIFLNGEKEPEVYTGVYTDLDYWQMVRVYFGK